MKFFFNLLSYSTISIALIYLPSSYAKDYLVNNITEYNSVVKKLKAGDTVILKNGTWKDFRISFMGSGTAQKPITLKAETDGKVIISGRSSLRIGGDYLVVSGLLFKDGYSPNGPIIEFRNSSYKARKSGNYNAYHSRLTNTVIDEFNREDMEERGHWVVLHGNNNRIDYSYFKGKTYFGQLIDVRVDNEFSSAVGNSIDHNYFGYMDLEDDSRGQSIRVGYEKYSQNKTHVTIKNNYFELCTGSRDLMLINTSNNIIEGNSIVQSFGSIVFRMGNNNTAVNNVILGNNIFDSGGIRIAGRGHRIYNNYIESVAGEGYYSALSLMNGDPAFKKKDYYYPVENAVIENNTIVNSRHVQIGTGLSVGKTQAPTGTTFKNNLFSTADNEFILSEIGDMSGIKYMGNKLNGFKDFKSRPGINTVDIALKLGQNGLYYPPKNSEAANAGVSRDIQPYLRPETGVSWYPLEQESGN